MIFLTSALAFVSCEKHSTPRVRSTSLSSVVFLFSQQLEKGKSFSLFWADYASICMSLIPTSFGNHLPRQLFHVISAVFSDLPCSLVVGCTLVSSVRSTGHEKSYGSATLRVEPCGKFAKACCSCGRLPFDVVDGFGPGLFSRPVF